MNDKLKETRRIINNESRGFIEGLISNSYLSDEDIQIINYKLKGKSNIEIQSILRMSESTYNRKWHRILMKLYNAM